MSIYSAPYPADGTDACPTQNVAQKIIRVACIVDGASSVRDLEQYIEWQEINGHRLPRIAKGYRVSQLREPIKSLWERMSENAKAQYLGAEYENAREYLLRCVENIQDELGDVDTSSLAIPCSAEFMSKWIK